MVHYKLTYFDLRGRGEPIRLIFIYNNIPFEDVRFQWDEWPAIKPTMPFEKAPVLEIDGIVLPESSAITRYLARKYGLAGKDDWEAAQLDAIADAQIDFFHEMIDWYLKKAYDMGDGDLDTLYREKWLPAANKHFPRMVKLLKESGSGYYAKSGLSWVDFIMSELTVTFYGFDPETLKKYPELLEHMERIHALPQLKEYIEQRKKTVT